MKKSMKKRLYNMRGHFYRMVGHFTATENNDIHCGILSDGDNPTFFGYHDKTPFNFDNSKILAMSYNGRDDLAVNECTPIRLGIFEKESKGKFHHEFHPFAITSTWCWQQGCMLQWFPRMGKNLVIFNTIVDGAYGSELFDIDQKQTIDQFPVPIYSLHPEGIAAICVNFARVGRLRPGYGYRLFPDNTHFEKIPVNDGLYLYDFLTREKCLIVSFSDLTQDFVDKNVDHYINHSTFSPDGSKILFFHLWASQGKTQGLRVCCYYMSDRNWMILDAENTVSHYCWKDGNAFIASTRSPKGVWRYILYDLKTLEKRDLCIPLNVDGHPMLNPKYKNLMVTDTYPDKMHNQHLHVVELDTRESSKIVSLYSPTRYRGQVRCDLHPRWDREGQLIAVDSVFKGKRKMIILDANKVI